MYRPNSRYARATPTTTGADEPAGARARLIECAVLLDIGFSAAGLVAFGVLDLITPTGAMWIAVLAIAFGGTAACVLWHRAGRIVDAGAPVTHTGHEHDAVIANVERRVLTHPFAR